MNPKQTPMRQSGFTIVEMMVGVLIGLIAIVVMFQIFAVSEAQKRTTAGAGEAQQNGMTSLYLLERDARMAGYGMGFLPLLGCNTWGFYNPTGIPFNFRLAPIVITNGAGGTAPDTIATVYGDTDTFQMPASLSGRMGPPGGTVGFVTVGEAPYQFTNGSIIVLGEASNTVPPLNPLINRNCTLFQITSQVAPQGADNTRIYFDALSYVDAVGNSNAAKFNPPLGVMPAPNNVSYNNWVDGQRTGGRVVNMGLNPTGNVYSIVNNQLVATNIFDPAAAPVIVSDNIVQLQAQYGYSSNCPPALPYVPAPVNAPANYIPPCAMESGAGSVPLLTPVWPPMANRSVWADALDLNTTTPNYWRSIVAMRFVIVARSTEKERVNKATGVCDATTVQPSWVSGDGRTLDISSANPTDWQCYRYRTFEGVVPIRNIIWSPDPAGSSVAPS